jgi:DNA-binding CsgD family transcriptional regulator
MEAPEARIERLKRLTNRQHEVLELRCEGKTYAEIAKILVVEVVTVKNHAGKIFDKLEISHLPEAARMLELGRFCSVLSHLPKTDIPSQVEPEPEEQPSPLALIAVQQDEAAIARQGDPILQRPTISNVRHSIKSRRLVPWIILLIIALFAGLVSAGAVSMIPWLRSSPPPMLPISTGQTASTLPKCYEVTTTISGTVSSSNYTYTGEFSTSSRCKDINIRFSRLEKPIYVTAVSCEDLKPLNDTSDKLVNNIETWQVVVSGGPDGSLLPDGTCFKLRMRGSNTRLSEYTASVAY